MTRLVLNKWYPSRFIGCSPRRFPVEAGIKNMRYRLNFAISLTLALFLAGHVFAITPIFQQGVGHGPITAPRDPELEKQSKHSLEVAKYYFYQRKPEKNDKEGFDRLNKAVLDRLQEIVDTNENFARIDDVYFMLGEVYKRMGDMDKAVQNWTKSSKISSDEKLKAEIQKRLDESNSQNKSEKKG